jgi:hypothetical protein
VLWRSEKARADFKASGRLNKFGLLVRVGDPSADVEHPYCRDRFGGPFAADSGSQGTAHPAAPAGAHNKGLNLTG